MDDGRQAGARASKARPSLSGIAYAAQASLFAWEEGIVVHEAISAFPNGRLLIDMTFKRRVASARPPKRPGRDVRAAARRRKRPPWGIQEGHLKRLIVLSRRGPRAM